MAGLNLLPWRDKEREQKKKQFFALLGLSALLAAGLVFLGNLYMNSAMSYQQERNRYLENEISQLDRQIEQIKKLDATKQALLGRMEVIENLQSTRPAIVHLFDEMATAMPDGMYLNQLKQSGTVVHVEGKAESNARVSSYMNRLDGSSWLSSSNLNIISVAREDGRATPLRDFKLDVNQLLKQAQEGGNESSGS
ncbi:MAG: PilN domain-containing protein [Thiothrix sp.]|nr:PilN domain-containing protein [Thiothrix sp.]HPQ95184.1 PilN domain-containing protein [Thiolinea sp.]